MRPRRIRHIIWLAISLACSFSLAAADWEPAASKLMTRWAKDVSPQHVWSEYPRPQMVRAGLAAAIYTQISDVEVEINGLLTYDREIEKMDAEVVGNANRKLYEVSP